MNRDLQYDSEDRHTPLEGRAADGAADDERARNDQDDDAETPAVEHDDDDANASTLSPAVRKLVKTYELDVTAIRGSGPSGRIRVGDVMAALGNRAAPAAAEESPVAADAADAAGAAVPAAAAQLQRRAPAAMLAPATTVFECDLGGVLSHRHRERGRDIALTAYFAAACVNALRAVPEVNAAHRSVDVAVHGMRDGRPTMHVIREANALSLDALHEALAAPPSEGVAPMTGTTIALRNYGSSGSLLAVPVPLDTGHAACVGIGKPRRHVVLASVDGVETTRTAMSCYLSLSYDSTQIDFDRANLYLATVVRSIERWPQS
jgi:2-oxoglutarate dehydrogenase E2 component (dihydrolipoamide succinyltransferase)